jgi:hypothetical protein
MNDYSLMLISFNQLKTEAAKVKLLQRVMIISITLWQALPLVLDNPRNHRLKELLVVHNGWFL